MPASVGVRSALRPLQSRHAATRFSRVLCPPRARGTTCSSSNSLLKNFLPQYWQMCPSRMRMFFLESV